MFWDTLLEPAQLSADAEHEFNGTQISNTCPVTHIRLNIFPDGGISRLRLFGTIG